MFISIIVVDVNMGSMAMFPCFCPLFLLTLLHHPTKLSFTVSLVVDSVEKCTFAVE